MARPHLGRRCSRLWSSSAPRQHLDWRDQGQITELGHWFRESELKCIPCIPRYITTRFGAVRDRKPRSNITEPLKAKRIGVVDEIKRVLEIAEIIPFRYMVQHLGGPGEEYDERKMEAAFTSLEELTVFARQRGVEILLENIPNGFSSPRGCDPFLRLRISI